MNRIKLISKTAQAIIAILVFGSAVSVAYAKDKDKECWVDFYQDSQYTGLTLGLRTEREHYGILVEEYWKVPP
jgi:hypothetical protein